MLDYGTLRFIWWLIMVFLLVGFAIMDGHDMGIGSLLPFLGKTDEERRVIINTVSAHWEGNQVWFITAGGALFAAIPMVYATAFSGFYWAMMAVLWALFFRPVAFKYRSLMPEHKWRFAWDWGLFIGSFFPPILFGVAIGNVLLGVPFYLDGDLRSYYTGSFWALLNPFALLCGLLSITMIIFHGAVYLSHRTIGEIHNRCLPVIKISGLLTGILFALAGIWIAFGIKGYLITSAIDTAGASNPLNKTVITETGAWLANYRHYPLIITLPILAYLGIIGAWIFTNKGKTFIAFLCSSATVLAIISTAGASMFPFLLPSSTLPNTSLTIWDSTSGQHSLLVMLIASVILMPIVLIYTAWAFRIMRGKVTKEYIRENEHSAY
nr:cytochrome d ubiquinol oxidase subunit II [Suttonella ornithocola]